jgi:hypothetical protein
METSERLTLSTTLTAVAVEVREEHHPIDPRVELQKHRLFLGHCKVTLVVAAAVATTIVEETEAVEQTQVAEGGHQTFLEAMQ